MTRRGDILEHLAVAGFQSVGELSEHFGVTESTIRRDLARLEELELVRRTHGGVIPTRTEDTPPKFRHEVRHREKVAIGRTLAAMVRDGQSVLLDGGSTCLEVARCLTHSRLTVVTNDLRVGLELARRDAINLVFIGGERLPNHYTMWGPAAVEQVKNLRVDVAIFGADSLNEGGVYHATSYEIELKRAMLAVCSSAYLAVDSSKFGRQGLFRVFGWESFAAAVTDSDFDTSLEKAYPVPFIFADTHYDHA